MTAIILDWPRDILKASGISFDQRGQSEIGPVSLTGKVQATARDSGYWMATVPLALISTKAQILVFRAIRSQLAGSVNLIRVPVWDEYVTPWVGGVEWEQVEDALSVHDDGSYHSDGSAYYQDTIDVTLDGAHDARATEITVDVNQAGTIHPGHYFSVNGGNRLHTIEKLRVESATNPTWAIWPPLRESLADGARLRFDKPTCLMRLMSDAEMDLALGLAWQARGIAMGLVEYDGSL